MNKETIILLIGMAIFSGALLTFSTPVPTPKAIDLSHVTQADIERTIAHRNALQEQIKGNLSGASADAKTAVVHADQLQGQIDQVARQAALVPELQKKLSAKDAAIWRNLVIEPIVLLGVLALLKIAAKVSIPFI